MVTAIPKTASQRGMEMMSIPMGQLPQLARDYATWKCNRVGMCMEVLMFCWCVYAQLIEKLEVDDPAYSASPEDIEWFENNAPSQS